MCIRDRFYAARRKLTGEFPDGKVDMKKLSRADKKQIEAAIARANRTDKKGKSAQDSIPYELSLIHI